MRKGESSLSFILKEILAVDVVNEIAAIAIIGDEMDKVSGY